MSPTKPLFALTAALGLLGFAGAAFAQTTQTCHTDGDCQHGYICPAIVPNGPTTPTCPPDGDCSATGTGGAPARHDASGTVVPTGGTGTVPITGAGGSSGIDAPAADGGTAAPGATSDPGTGSPASVCQPGPCAVDSDCAAGMVCHGETYATCSGGGARPPCQAGTKCDTSGVVTDPTTCTTQTVSTCTFKWALPCSADADCGDGFACQPSLTVSCSGGTAGGTGSGAGAASGAGEPVADSCTTSMNFPGSCHPVAVTCSSDADCPSDWICQDDSTVISSPGTGGIGAGGATMAPSGNEGSPVSGSGSGVSSAAVASDTTTVAPPTFSRSCVAPYSSVTPTEGAGGRSGSAPSGNDGTPPSGTGTTTSTGGTTGAHQPTAPGTGGTTGTTTGSGAVDTKISSADNSGGCSISPTGGSSRAGLLAGLGLGIATLVARRRRSR